MKEEEPNWFSRWENELPSPEELTPLSQTLITPDLALAFGIGVSIGMGVGISPSSPPGHVPTSIPLYSLDRQLPDPLPPSRAQSQTPPVLEYESPDLGSGGGECGGGGGGGPGGGADDQARTLKRPRLVWTPQLHKRFVDAVAHLGIKNAVPKTIMQLMSVDGLTRENVASHLQKYRLYLKRMQGLSGGGGAGGVNGAGSTVADAATERLFASGPLPQQFLSRGGGGADPFVLPLHHHQQQQFYHRQQLGSSPPSSVAGFDHGFLGRQPQPGIHRVVGPAPVSAGPGGVVSPVSMFPFAKDFDAESTGRKELSLFPTNDD